VSSYGGNIVSGRWALANRGMLDQQRTKTSKQSTAQIQAQSLEMEAVHLTSVESTPGADFWKSAAGVDSSEVKSSDQIQNLHCMTKKLIFQVHITMTRVKG
jgi:hypothetical protein